MTNTKETKRKSILKNFYPDYIFEKVEDIPYDLISREGIRLILMDMDNTLIDFKGKSSKNLKKWIKMLKSKDVKLYIISNSFSEEKVKRVSKELGVKYFFKAKKPLSRGFKMVCDFFPDISKKEIMMVGDQLFTDIYGGNKFNIKTVLVKRINKRENFVSKFKRPVEKVILNHYYNKEENSEKCRV